jgi:hypothetical protein
LLSNQSIVPINPTTVIDAKKKVVGQIVPFMNECSDVPISVAYKFGKRIFSVGVNKVGFAKCQLFYIFESSDFSGTPYKVIDPSLFIEGARVGEPNSTLYISDIEHIKQNVQSHSTQEWPGWCNSNADNIIQYAAPEVPLIDLETIFTPPFKVK